MCIIYAVTKGYLNDIAVEDIPSFEQQLEKMMDTQYFDVLDSIRTSGKLEQAAEQRLIEALDALRLQMSA